MVGSIKLSKIVYILTNLSVCSVIGIKFWLFKVEKENYHLNMECPHRLFCLDVVPQWVALFGEPVESSGRLKEVGHRMG